MLLNNVFPLLPSSLKVIFFEATTSLTQGGYRSVSMLAKGEAEGLIYVARSSLKVRLKLPLLRVMVANYHGKKDTRLG